MWRWKAVSPKYERTGEYRGGFADLPRTGNPLKARRKPKSRQGWRVRLGGFFQALPGGEKGRAVADSMSDKYRDLE